MIQICLGSEVLFYLRLPQTRITLIPNTLFDKIQMPFNPTDSKAKYQQSTTSFLFDPSTAGMPLHSTIERPSTGLCILSLGE